ncbi:MAG: ABC transporter permease [Ferrovibrionaceae bacterium]
MMPIAPGRLAGFGLLTLLVVFALAAPLLVPGDPTRQSLADVLLPPGGGFVLGTDQFGRNMALRLAAAIRLSLGIAALTTASAGIVGVALGILAGAAGGWVDRVISACADMVLALPGLLLVLLLVAIAPGRFWPLYLGVSLVLWVEFFRMTRAAAARIAASPAVEASRLLGFGPWYLFRRHYWPDIAPIILTVGAFGSATSVMSVAALGFVNVGVRPPTPELGQMLIELMPFYNEAPLILAQPIAAIFLLVLGLNLIAAGKTQ